MTGEPDHVPLALTANRAGRAIGESVATGELQETGGMAGTAIVKGFDLGASRTGIVDEERAADVLRLGVGPTVALYCEARTGEDWHRFDERAFSRLQTTLDRWLACYGACYGVDLEGGYSIRTAAELLVETHDARAVAAVLTGVPDR